MEYVKYFLDIDSEYRIRHSEFKEISPGAPGFPLRFNVERLVDTDTRCTILDG